jgi:hypothetical protein
MSILHYFVRLNEHAMLLEAMIAKLGLTGRLNALPEHKSVMKQAGNRCLACNRSMDCSDWLSSTEARTQAPRYCRNHALFAGLAGTERLDRFQNSP